MIELNYPFPTISDGEQKYYGGRQACLPTKTLQGYGCGLISAANVMLCLDRRDGLRRGIFGELAEDNIPLAPFIDKAVRMRRYIPILPKIGVNGIMLVQGMRRYFRKNRMPYHARWCFGGKKLWERIENMLRDGIPPIFCIGPNFPRFWRKDGVTFYRKQNGEYVPFRHIKEHYVTVTGIDSEWVRISSWGHEYYVNRNEYALHVRKYSNYIFNNIALITKK